MAVRVVTPPAVEPVSLVEAKAHLRLEESLDDTYVTTLIETSRQFVEGELERGLLLQTLELSTERPAGSCTPVPLPGGVLADAPAVAVHYLDADGVEQELDAAEFYVVSRGQTRPGELRLVKGSSWPDMAERPDALRVQYAVGWATAELVPRALCHAVLLMLSALYEHRSPEQFLASTAMQALMAPYEFRSI